MIRSRNVQETRSDGLLQQCREAQISEESIEVQTSSWMSNCGEALQAKVSPASKQ